MRLSTEVLSKASQGITTTTYLDPKLHKLWLMGITSESSHDLPRVSVYLKLTTVCIPDTLCVSLGSDHRQKATHYH